MAMISTGTYEVDPITRIEGHLGVKVHVGADGIDEAWAHGNLWRGFENFLVGRNTNDAITFTQRICGVCPLPHATASTFATESVLGVSDGYITFADDGAKGVPAKAVLIRNLTYSAEFLMSAITHFYHLGSPSYVQGPNMAPWTPYFADGDYHSLLLSGGRALPEKGTVSGGAKAFSKDLWSAVITSYVKALRMRRLTFDAGAVFCGRMPMVSSYVAGGVTNEKNDPKHSEKCTAYETAMTEVARFIFKEYIPIALALGYLYKPWDNSFNDATNGKNYGAGCKNFLAWGAFPGGADGTGTGLAFSGGYYIDGPAATPEIFMSGKGDLAAAKTSVETNLKEVITRSRYAKAYEYETVDEAYPGAVSRTVPERADENKYSWLKAPRWKGEPMEVGPFARLVVNGLYPVDGSAISGKFSPYALYLKTVNGQVGLNPAMVDADLAVALVRSGAANVYLWDGTTATTVSKTNIDNFDEATIVAAYSSLSDFGDAVIVDGPDHALVSWIKNLKGGFSTMDRLRARALEAGYLATLMIGAPSISGMTINFGATSWIDSLKGLGAADGYKSYPIPGGQISGMGVSEAPRGALAHFVTSNAGRIVKYQCVVPTTWNASPKDGADGVGKRGPMEAAMIGVPFEDRPTATGRVSGVEVLRVAQSFDPCIACAVH